MAECREEGCAVWVTAGDRCPAHRAEFEARERPALGLSDDPTSAEEWTRASEQSAREKATAWQRDGARKRRAAKRKEALRAVWVIAAVAILLTGVGFGIWGTFFRSDTSGSSAATAKVTTNDEATELLVWSKCQRAFEAKHPGATLIDGQDDVTSPFAANPATGAMTVPVQDADDDSGSPAVIGHVKCGLNSVSGSVFFEVQDLRDGY